MRLQKSQKTMSESTLKLGVLKKYAYNKIYIETGTADGQSVEIARSAGFKRIITIEAAPRVFERACKRFAFDDNVLCILGDSGSVLPNILHSINEPITFFLDAHWSTGEPDLPNGVSKCPLLNDVIAIRNHSVKTHTILIDDIRYFRGAGIEQWGNITIGDILEIIMQINPEYQISFEAGSIENDILVATIQKEK